MRAVVTGGAGFIGSHLCAQLLEKAFDVTIIDNYSTGRYENIEIFKNDIEIIEADLSEYNLTWSRAVAKADFVFHLASLADIVPSIENPVEYFNSNVTSTLNVLRACSANLKKFIYAASSSCYGKAKQYPTTENCPLSPEYPYALTKLMGEQLVLHWAKVYDLPSISTRFFNVYGTRSRTSGTYGAVFGVFLAQRLNNSPLTIVGDGSQTRDFTYVTDVCRGMIQAAESGFSGEVFNIGSGKPTSISYLAELIGGPRVYIPKRPGEPDITHADISKARRLLGYKPEITFEEGVKLVLDDIHYWKDAPVWVPETISKATEEWFDRLQ